MNLCELVFSVCLLTASLGLFSNSVGSVGKQWKKYSYMKSEYIQDSFIVQSFSQLCEEKRNSNEDFEQWSSMCSSLFPLDSISVIKEAGENEIKCQWVKGGKTKSIVCRRDK